MNPSHRGEEGVDRDPLPITDGITIDLEKYPWYVWGGQLWAFQNAAFIHPSEPHPDGAALYLVQIRLRRNDAAARVNETKTGRDALTGDSELVIRGYEEDVLKHALLSIPGIAEPAFFELIENENGRAGALSIGLALTNRFIDVYRIAQSAFNRLAVSAAVMWGVPLRRDGMQIVRLHEDDARNESALVVPIGYADRPAILSINQSTSLVYSYGKYAEGLRTNSPFYALLCFFTLTEYITGSLQGRLRRLCGRVPIDYIDLKGALTNEDVRFLGRFAAGTSYRELLDKTRDTRNAIAHFIMEDASPRPSNVASEDEVSFFADTLKIASRHLLEKLEQNVVRFKEAGVSDGDLYNVFNDIR